MSLISYQNVSYMYVSKIIGIYHILLCIWSNFNIKYDFESFE